MSPTPMAITLELRQVTLALKQRLLVAPLTLQVAAGQVTTIMGPSGSGKSTLLAFLCGTLAPAFTASGSIWVAGRDVTHLPPEQRQLGILFQDDLLFPHLSVGENLAFGLAANVRAKSERRVRIEQALEEAGLAGFAKRDPATLSGGQRARVALLRTLLSEPRALLLDEPFAKLDVDTRERFRHFVFSHAKERCLPTLMVTHDPSDVQAAGGPIVALDLVN